MTDKAEALVRHLSAASLRLVLAESCTAGLAADRIAQVPGASAVLWGSFVSYTEAAKEAMLGVSADLLARHGAVSRETAQAMAAGALERSGADIAAAVTGLAGPGGDERGTPLGTVWIALQSRDPEIVRAECFCFTGSRQEIRSAAAERILELLLQVLCGGLDKKKDPR